MDQHQLKYELQNSIGVFDFAISHWNVYYFTIYVTREVSKYTSATLNDPTVISITEFLIIIFGKWFASFAFNIVQVLFFLFIFCYSVESALILSLLSWPNIYVVTFGTKESQTF